MYSPKAQGTDDEFKKFIDHTQNTHDGFVTASIASLLIRLNSKYFAIQETRDVDIANVIETLKKSLSEYFKNDDDLGLVLDYILELENENLDEFDQLIYYEDETEKNLGVTLKETIAIIFSALNDDDAFPERSSEDKQDHFLTLFNCFKDLQKATDICHAGIRNQLVLCLNHVYPNVKIVEEIHSFFQDELINFIQSKLIEKTPKEQFNILRSWMTETDDEIFPAFIISDKIMDEAKSHLEKLCRENGFSPNAELYSHSSQSGLKPSKIIEERIKMIEFLPVPLSINKHAAKLKSLLSVMSYFDFFKSLEQKSELQLPLADNQYTLVKEILDRCNDFDDFKNQKLNKWVKYHEALKKVRNFQNFLFIGDEEAALMESCQTLTDSLHTFFKNFPNIQKETIQDIEQNLTRFEERVTQFNENKLPYEFIRDYYALVNSSKEQEKNDLQQRVVQFKDALILSDSGLKTLLKEVRKGSTLNLTPYIISRFLLHASFIEPNEWTEDFYACFERIFQFIEAGFKGVNFEAENFENAEEFKKSSFPSELIEEFKARQYNYLCTHFIDFHNDEITLEELEQKSISDYQMNILLNQNNNNKTAWYHLIEKNEAELVKSIIQNYTLDTKNAIDIALKLHKWEILDCLLDEGNTEKFVPNTNDFLNAMKQLSENEDKRELCKKLIEKIQDLPKTSYADGIENFLETWATTDNWDLIGSFFSNNNIDYQWDRIINKGNKELIDYAIKREKISVEDAIQFARNLNKLDIWIFLFEKIDFKNYSAASTDDLLISIQCENWTLFENLIFAGAEFPKERISYSDPLFPLTAWEALIKKKQTPLVINLLDSKTPITLKSRNGLTLIEIAIVHQQWGIVEKIAENYVNTLNDPQNFIPAILKLSEFEDQQELCKKIITKVRYLPSNGYGSKNHIGILEELAELGKWELVELFLEHDNVPFSMEDMKKVLPIAAAAKKWPICELLLDNNTPWHEITILDGIEKKFVPIDAYFQKYAPEDLQNKLVAKPLESLYEKELLTEEDIWYFKSEIEGYGKFYEVESESEKNQFIQIMIECPDFYIEQNNWHKLTVIAQESGFGYPPIFKTMVLNRLEKAEHLLAEHYLRTLYWSNGTYMDSTARQVLSIIGYYEDQIKLPTMEKRISEFSNYDALIFFRKLQQVYDLIKEEYGVDNNIKTRVSKDLQKFRIAISKQFDFNYFHAMINALDRKKSAHFISCLQNILDFIPTPSENSNALFITDALLQMMEEFVKENAEKSLSVKVPILHYQITLFLACTVCRLKPGTDFRQLTGNRLPENVYESGDEGEPKILFSDFDKIKIQLHKKLFSENTISVEVEKNEVPQKQLRMADKYRIDSDNIAKEIFGKPSEEPNGEIQSLSINSPGSI